MENYQEYADIDLGSLIKVLFRKWYIILILTISCGGLGYLYTISIQEEYTAHSSLIVEISNSNESEYTDILMGQKLIGTYKEFILSDKVISRVKNELGLSDSVEELKEKINVSTVRDTLILDVSATTNNKVMAYNIVSKTVEVLLDLSTEYSTLESIELLDQARVPNEPNNNNSLLYLTVSIMLGGMISVFLIFVLEYFDNKVRSEKDVEEVLGLKVLGTIPEYDVKNLKES